MIAPWHLNITISITLGFSSDSFSGLVAFLGFDQGVDLRLFWFVESGRSDKGIVSRNAGQKVTQNSN